MTSGDTGEGLRVSEKKKKKKNKHLQHTAGGRPVQGALFTVQHTGVPAPRQEFLQGSKSRRSWQESKVLYYTGELDVLLRAPVEQRHKKTSLYKCFAGQTIIIPVGVADRIPLIENTSK